MIGARVYSADNSFYLILARNNTKKRSVLSEWEADGPGPHTTHRVLAPGLIAAQSHIWITLSHLFH